MNWNDFFLTVVLPILSGGGAGWALVYFFGQRLVDHRLAKDLEHYREELKENTEMLKSQLSIYAHEQTVAISRVDLQRSEAIRKVYTCVRSVINPVTTIVAGSPIRNGTPDLSAQFYFEHALKAQQAIDVLSNTLADFAIYFDNHTYTKVRDFIKAVMGATGVYLDSLSPLVANNHPSVEILAVAERGRPLMKDQFDSAMTPRVKELVAIFRTQLGIEPLTSQTLKDVPAYPLKD